MTIVREFHEAFDIPAHDQPGMPDVKRLQLRRRLIKEEFKEVMEELDRIEARLERGYSDAAEVYMDLAALAKELSDLRYVCWGTDLEFGLPSEEVDREVHRSNMSKLFPDGKPRHRHDGKVIKPPTYRDPDILSVVGFTDTEGELIQ